MEENEMFVVVAFGEYYSSTHSRETALRDARGIVDQYMQDHMSGASSVEVTPEMARNFDVRVYGCGPSSIITLPFQEWVDENIRHRQEYAKESEEIDYKRFLELRKLYEDRYQQEKSQLPQLPNCS